VAYVAVAAENALHDLTAEPLPPDLAALVPPIDPAPLDSIALLGLYQRLFEALKGTGRLSLPKCGALLLEVFQAFSGLHPPPWHPDPWEPRAANADELRA